MQGSGSFSEDDNDDNVGRVRKTTVALAMTEQLSCMHGAGNDEGSLGKDNDVLACARVCFVVVWQTVLFWSTGIFFLSF